MVTLLVASTGGHLAQLADIADRLPVERDGERLWLTHDNAQSRSLLACERVQYIPYIGVRDVPGVLRTVPFAHRLAKEESLSRVVSTGSGIALAFLPYLAARGVPAHYVESAARVVGPSLSGRLLHTVPRVHLYTQYRAWEADRWKYGGSVFDGYSVEPEERPVVRRAVVTLGTAAEFPFRRLVDALVSLLGHGGALEREQGHPIDTLWQTGATDVEDLPIRAHRWLPADELDQALAATDLVVAHAGTGSALAALAAGRYPVLVPRQKGRGEAGDDHQAELARDLAARQLAVHREVESLDTGSLRAAATRRVIRREQVPPFELEG
jgi:UDP-N-acetylglucosamine--N-acetylmuramyl-(pentapeptide) pyrophosphoryl-undecaprenol N-acetylglucosamine transferase